MEALEMHREFSMQGSIQSIHVCPRWKREKPHPPHRPAPVNCLHQNSFEPVFQFYPILTPIQPSGLAPEWVHGGLTNSLKPFIDKLYGHYSATSTTHCCIYLSRPSTKNGTYFRFAKSKNITHKEWVYVELLAIALHYQRASRPLQPPTTH